jgi:hypothetical protein
MRNDLLRWVEALQEAAGQKRELPLVGQARRFLHSKKYKT